MTRVWPTNIIQLPTSVHMIFGFTNSYRVIYLDGRKHTDPDIAISTYNGESIKQADVNLLAYPLKEVTGAPIRYAGVGETLDKFEEFRAEGMAGRVLGMGDVVGLMKDFEEVVDEKDAAEKAIKMLEGQFSLDDFLEQIRMIQKMGSIKDLIAKMPGMSDMMPPGVDLGLTTHSVKGGINYHFK